MSLTQASDSEKMQVKITSDKQSKNGDEQFDGMSVSEDASLQKFSDPAILFVRETMKIQYSRAELMRLRESPLSKRKPDFFNPSDLPPAILDPDRWHAADRKKSEPPSEGGGAAHRGGGAASDSSAPPTAEPRRRVAIAAANAPADPRERVRKENDGIVLSPQRRSFNTGCFVPASSGARATADGRAHSPSGGKNDGPHFGIREIQPSNRRIGSGRILRDTWDFGDKPDQNGGDCSEYGFRGAHQHRGGGGGDDKYESRRGFDRDYGKERGERGEGGGGGRRNARYDRRRISDHREMEEPEWFSGGPTSQNDTIELRGFDDGKKKMSPSRSRRAKEWSKKKNEATQRQTTAEEREETKDAPRRSTPSPQDGKTVERSPPKADIKKSEDNSAEKTQTEVKMDAAEEGFNLEDFLKCDNIPGLLTNGIGADEENTTSRFSRWFNKQASPEKPPSRRSSIHDDHPSIIRNLLEDIDGSGALAPMPGDSEAYFAPISPAGNTGNVIGANRMHQHLQQAQPVNIMEMLQKVGGGGGTAAPPAGKILSLDELESKIRHNVEAPAPKQQPQKPDEEMAAAFKKLLVQAQAGVHPAASSGPMNKQPMSLLEMLNHSQQQDEAARRMCPPPQQQMGGGDLAIKLQHAQHLQHQKQQQMEMLNKLINATATSPMHHHHQQQQMRVSPLQEMGLQQSRELLNRPEAQAILQGLKRGEITTQHLYQQLANPALQPRHREMLATVLKTQGGGGYGPSPRALSPQLPPHHVYQQQLSVSPLPSVNAIHQRIPSPRELQLHTQNILQRALIKKKLEEQQENYRKKQEMQRGQSPSGQAKNTASPTPLTFTPTSVLRKMTADKDEGKENKGLPLGRALTGMRAQPAQAQGSQWGPQFSSLKHQAGRPIVKANNNYQTQTAEQFFSQHQAQQQQQQRMFNQPPPGMTSAAQQQQQRGNKVGQQFSSMGGQSQQGVSQAQYNPPQYSTNQQFNPQQLRAQHQHRPNQPQQVQQQQPPQQQQRGFQQQNVGSAAWQQFFGNAQQGQRTSTASAAAQSSMDRLPSPTADQLSRWFSPDLLERARGGELPSTANLMARRGAASLEEIERQAAATPVRN